MTSIKYVIIIIVFNVKERERLKSNNEVHIQNGYEQIKEYHEKNKSLNRSLLSIYQNPTLVMTYHKKDKN